MKEKSHIKHFAFAYVSILVLAISVATLYFWIFDVNYPVEANNIHVEKVEDNLVYISFDIIKKRQCIGSITRQIIDSNNIVWDLHTDNESTYLEIGEHDFTKVYRLPFGIPSGQSYYKSIVLWRCNPLKTIRQEYALVPFNIPS